MLRFLFPRLTAESDRSAELFAAVTAEARKRHWYIEGDVPDTVDGRFAMLATVTALVTVRLEELGEKEASVALTERFIEVMESEHREMGLGDPTLGKTVRKLVGSLARRVELWRTAVAVGNWIEATHASVYRSEEVSKAAASHSAEALRDIWSRLESQSADALAQGRFE